jgi:hypothetical protein
VTAHSNQCIFLAKLEQMRAAIRKAVPEAVEGIGYGRNYGQKWPNTQLSLPSRVQSSYSRL